MPGIHGRRKDDEGTPGQISFTIRGIELSDVLIRNATEPDFQMVKGLVKELYDALEIKEGMNKELSKKKYKDLLNDSKVAILVAESDGVVIGYLTLNFNRSLLDANITAIIDELIVSKDHRGKGVGSKLVTIAIKRCRYNGCSEIGVGTEFSNAAARKFYERCGFSEIGVIFDMMLE